MLDLFLSFLGAGDRVFPSCSLKVNQQSAFSRACIPLEHHFTFHWAFVCLFVLYDKGHIA